MTSSPRTITTRERHNRLVRRHHLGRTAGDVATAAQGIVGFHGTDPASVYLAAWARVERFESKHLEATLYEERTLVRILGMRRTMFVLPTAIVPVVQSACTRALAAGERRRTLQLLEGAGFAKDPARWLDHVASRTLDVLRDRGEATANALTKEIPELRERIPVGEGKKWAGEIGVVTRVLFLLATEGHIVRARPLGSWVSSQYRWTPVETWLGSELPVLEDRAARAELARSWLASFGPGTRGDLKWWTGWTAAEVKRALAEVGPTEVELDGRQAWCRPTMSNRLRRLTHGSHCCRRSTRRRWAGPSAAGISAHTRPGSSTGPEMPVRRCGVRAASWVVGHSAPTVSSSGASSTTWAPTRSRPSRQPRRR